jgi:hypothetical protein
MKGASAERRCRAAKPRAVNADAEIAQRALFLMTSIGFRLARGGVFYAILRRLRLARDDERDVRRQAVALLAVSWLPLVAISALEWLMGTLPASIISEPSVHVRLLVALPLFIASEHSLDHRCQVAISEFVHGGFSEDVGAVERIVEGAARCRDARWPELLLLGTAVVLSQYLLWAHAGSAGLLGEVAGEAPPLSGSRVWYALVCLPIFQFLLTRSIWHWVIWSRLLWQLSRLRLRLIPTHPDLAGGLGHLSRPVSSLALALSAASAVIASAWSEQILAGQAVLQDFALSCGLLVVLAELVALGPLAFFIGHLFRGRAEGLHQYGAFALRYTSEFHNRWIAGSKEPKQELLGAADIQSLADLANSFKVVESMRPIPFGPQTLYLVLVATLVPMLPLSLTVMSLPELVTAIGRALLGAPR